MFIKSIGYYIPEGRLGNQEITDILSAINEESFDEDTFDFIKYNCSRKFEFLGLETRSYPHDAEVDSFASMARTAAENAIEKSGLKPEEIDCIIFSGVTNPYREPSFAIFLANSLGIETGDFFDINDTCSGFMKSIEIAGLYINSGRYRNILIATCESPYELTESMKLNIRIKNLDQLDLRFSGLVVGTGAAAMVLSAEGDGASIQNYGEQRRSTEWDASVMTIPDTAVPGSKYGDNVAGFWADGRLISSSLIKDMPDFVLRQLKEWHLDIESIDLFIHHQLGNNVTFALMDKIGASHDKAPINTYREFGNMAAANIPVNLAIAEERGLIGKGDSVLLLSSSCGLSYSLVHIIW